VFDALSEVHWYVAHDGLLMSILFDISFDVRCRSSRLYSSAMSSRLKLEVACDATSTRMAAWNRGRAFPAWSFARQVAVIPPLALSRLRSLLIEGFCDSPLCSTCRPGPLLSSSEYVSVSKIKKKLAKIKLARWSQFSGCTPFLYSYLDHTTQ